jgi:hypothetical protein
MIYVLGVAGYLIGGVFFLLGIKIINRINDSDFFEDRDTGQYDSEATIMTFIFWPILLPLCVLGGLIYLLNLLCRAVTGNLHREESLEGFMRKNGYTESEIDIAKKELEKLEAKK